MKLRKTAVLLLAVIMLAQLFSCAKSPVIMSYNGHSIRENMYSFWMSSYKRNILLSYSDAFDTAQFWNGSYSDEKTVEDYFTEIIRNRVTDYLIADSLLREYRLSLDAETKQAIRDDINEKIEYYGGRKALNGELSNIGIDINTLTEIYTVEEKYATVYDYLFNNGPETPTEEEITDYYTENYNRILYIVFYKTKIVLDENGEYAYDDEGYLITEEMSDEELAEKEKTVEKCLERLRGGEDFASVGKEMTEYDTSAYPNGFFVSKNEVDVWGDQIILGSAQAKDNEVFRVDEDHAVYLVKKLPLTPIDGLDETDISQLSQLYTYVERQKCENFFAKLRPQVKYDSELLVKYTLSKVKVNPYYGF